MLRHSAGIEGEWEGIGHCAVSYIDGEKTKALKRKGHHESEAGLNEKIVILNGAGRKNGNTAAFERWFGCPKSS